MGKGNRESRMMEGPLMKRDKGAEVEVCLITI